MIPGSANPLLLAADAAAGGYSIARSLRFNSPDSAYLGPRTFSTPTSSTAWTWASWIKKTLITTSTDYRGIFDAGSGSNYAYLDFSDNNIRFVNRPTSGTIAVLQTTQVFRDPGAWFHVVFVYDSANSTSTDRLRLYVNGARVTAFSTATYPDSSQASVVNSAVAHRIGWDSGNFGYLDAYLADIHFIDGQALTPTSFGEFDATTGVWNPKAYTGTYGTNGYQLKFEDNSNNTATTLGKDTSGNGNNWTPSNLSVTAGAGNDSLVDSPTNGTASSGGDAGGTVVGNYCTWNPLDKGGGTLSNGNLDFAHSSASYVGTRSTIAFPSSGKWYFEITIGSTLGALVAVVLGIATSQATLTNHLGSETYSYAYGSFDGKKLNNQNTWNGTAYGNSFTNGDVIGVAFDADTGSLYFYKNGTVQNSGTAAFTGLTTATYFPAVTVYGQGGTCTIIANFGQRPFAYAAPAGFKSLNTANLPTPTILAGNTAFDTKLYTGNGSTQTISGLAFSGGAPDLVWIKSRSSTYSHRLFDTVRGATKAIYSNSTAAEETMSSDLTAFNSDGFALGSGVGVNESNTTFAAWCWDAGSSNATNTQGSITSTVRANASAGFSVVTFTAQSSGSATIGHGLGVAPELIIVKSRAQTYSWLVYHKNLTSNAYYLILNSTAAQDNTSNAWNSTTPTSTVFTLGSTYAGGGNTVAYCFAPVSGYSSFGSYTGNGSADGPFVYTGFRPRYLLIKRSDSTGSWYIMDTARNTYNYADLHLYPNLSSAEAASSHYTDILSNGFKARGSATDLNASGGAYVYACFSENPFSIARAR